MRGGKISLLSIYIFFSKSWSSFLFHFQGWYSLETRRLFICAHSAALYYFLWTTTTANHHGKQPLTAVCTLSPCSIWWKAAFLRNTATGRWWYLLREWCLGAGGDIVAKKYERSGFCPIGWEEHFPTDSQLVCWPLPPVRCDSPSAAVCHHRVKYCLPVASCCTEMHHTPSLSVGENMSTLAARAHTAPERCNTLSRPRLPTQDKGSFFHNESSNLHRNWI